MLVALTTIDNPYDPIDEFDEWHAFDRHKGYLTCERLASVAKVTTEMADEDQDSALEEAIDFICEWNPTGLYKKIKR